MPKYENGHPILTEPPHAQHRRLLHFTALEYYPPWSHQVIAAPIYLHYDVRVVSVWFLGDVPKAATLAVGLDIVGEEGGEPLEVVEIENSRDGVDAKGVGGQDIEQRCEEADEQEEGALVPPNGPVEVSLMVNLGGGHQWCWFFGHGDDIDSQEDVELIEGNKVILSG